MAGAEGILGTLRILVDADSAKAEKVLKSLGGKAQIAGAAIGAGFGVAGIAGLKMGDTYDSALDGIRASTGATGEVLSGLEGTMNSVAGRVTESLEIVGGAVAELHKRTGQTGAGLEATAESLIDLARLTGTDYAAAVEKVSALYVNWNVAAEDQIALNDTLLRAYQQTGISVDTLTDSLAKNGAILRTAGFSMEESIALIAGLEEAGIDAAAVMGPLRKSITEAAEAGIPAGEAIEGVFAAIADAPDDIQATQMALAVFGAKGAQMATLIREGKLSVDDLFNSIASGGDTVQAASDDTRDFADGIAELKNQLTSAVGPITSVFAGISDALGNAIFLLPAVTGAIGKGLVKVFQSGPIAKAAQLGGAAIGKVVATAMMGAQFIAQVAGSAWDKIGALAGGRFGLAFKVAAIAGIALLFVEVWNQWNIFQQTVAKAQEELQVKASGAVAQAGDEAVKNLANLTTHLKGLQGFDRILADTWGGAQEVEGLRNLGQAIVNATDLTAAEIEQSITLLGEASAEAMARGNTAIGDELLTMQETMRTRTAAVVGEVEGLAEDLESEADKLAAVSFDPLAGATITPPDIAGPIRDSFKVATQAVAEGFGAIKAAIANPPQMISKGDRLENMAARMRKIMKNLHKSVEADDPISIGYWEKARAKQQLQVERMRGNTVASTKDIKTAYRQTGAEVGGVWRGIRVRTQRESAAAADAAISEFQGIEDVLSGMNFVDDGASIGNEVASGIRLSIPNADAAAAELAAAVAEPIEAESPPKSGPLHDIDKWGPSLIDAWLKPMEGSTARIGRVGAKLAGALSPNARMNGLALAGAGAGGGGGNTYNVGVLVADDRGVDALDRRMERRRKTRGRGPMRFRDTD